VTTDRRPTASPATESTERSTAEPSPEPIAVVLQRAVDEAARLVRADGALISLRDETTGALALAYGSNTVRKHARAWTSSLQLREEGGLINQAIGERRVRWTGDYLEDPTFPAPKSAQRIAASLGIRSFVAAPLVVGDRAIGALSVYADRVAAFDEAQIALVKALADHAAASIANDRLIAQLDRSRESLARRAAAEHTLRDIARRLAGMRDPAGILQYTVDEARRLVGADGARIDAGDPGTDVLRFSFGEIVSGEIAPARFGPGEVRHGEGVAGRAVETGRPFRTGDYVTDRSFDHASVQDAFAQRTRVRSVLSAPLPGPDRPIGALSVLSRRRDAFDEEDEAVIAALADHAGIAIANARLIGELGDSREDLRRRADAEVALREIAIAISAIQKPTEIVQRTVDEAARLLEGSGARIDLIDRELNVLRLAYQSGAARPTEDEWGTSDDDRLDHGVSGRAVVDGRVFITGDYLNDTRFLHGQGPDGYVRNTGISSAIAAPLIGETGPFGALTVWSGRPDAFGEGHATVLEALANQAAIALTNAGLIDELRRSRGEIERRARSERALREVAARLTAVRDPGALLQLVVDEASRLVQADGAILALLDAERGVLGWSYDDGLQRKFDPQYVGQLTLAIGTGVTGRAVAEGRVIAVARDLVNQFPLEPESLHYFEVTGFQSMIAAPIVGEDGPLGALEVYWTSVDAFTDQDVELIEAFANQAAIAITNARLIEQLAQSRQEVERRAEAERALHQIGAHLTAIRDPADVLQQAVDAAARLLKADGALLDLVDPESGIIRWAYDSGIRDEGPRQILRDLEIPVGSGLFGRAVAEQRVVVSGDYGNDDRFRHLPGADQFVTVVGLRSLVAAPLIGESGPLGVLGVYSSRVNAFDEADLALLGAFADQATVAISNSRLIDELARSRAEVARRAESERTLRQIAARITALRDPAEVLQQVVDDSKRLLVSDGAHLTLMSDDRTYVYPVVVAGGTDEATESWLKTQQFPIGGGMNGLAAETGEPAWTADYLADPRIPHEPDDQDVARRMSLRGMAVAPLRAVGGETLGTLAVSYEQPRQVSPDEIELLQGLADQAAIAVTNLRLYDRLAGSEARYRFLVQNAPDIVWSFDEEGRWTFVSPAVERIGWRIEQLLGQPFWDLVHEDHRDELVARWREAVATGTGDTQRFRSALRTPEGIAVAVEIVGNPIIEDGRLLGAYGVTHDIREQDRLERELRESESRYRNLVQTSPDVVWVVGADGTFTYLGDRIEELIGRRPGELIGEPWEIIVAPDGLPLAQKEWQALSADPELILHIPLVLRHVDGSDVATEVSAVSIRIGGEFGGAHGSIRDVRERERLLRELRDSESRFRYLVETSPDLIWQVDADGRFTFLSDTTEAIVGWRPDELLGTHFTTVIAERSLAVAEEDWATLASEPGIVQALDTWCRRRDGSDFPTEIIAVGSWEAGRFTGAHGSVRDITERARLERDLRQQAAELASSDERAHLARELHDSVTQGLFSMTLLTRSIELLLERDPAAAAEKLVILRELQRDALAETRALIFELRPSSLDQDGLVKALRTHVAAVQGRIGLPVVIEADDVGRLPHDVEDALYRIAQEGLHNVVKHANARQVTIRLESRPPNVRLTVEDDGAGFDSAAVPGGHLGLAGMRARAEKVGGTLSVASRKGRGTTIEAVVPADATHADGAGSAK